MRFVGLPRDRSPKGARLALRRIGGRKSMEGNVPGAPQLELSFLIGRFVADHLIRVHRYFDGDLVAALVLATIANRNLHRYYEDHAKPSGIGLDRLISRGDHIDRLLHCNAYSVSSATGIPRETVRRKVKWLEKKGWIEVAERGEIFIAKDIGHQFADFDAGMIERFLDTARQALEIDDAPAFSGDPDSVD
jgi:hypothetical protein